MYKGTKKILLFMIIISFLLVSFFPNLVKISAFYFTQNKNQEKDSLQYNVTFDESNSPLASLDNSPGVNAIRPGGFEVIGQTLIQQSNNFEVSTIGPGNDISSNTFSTLGINLLIIPCSQERYTTNELEAIENWVNSGGYLFVIGDWGHWGDCFEVIERFGFARKNDILYDTITDESNLAWISFNESNFIDHPILNQISEIEIYAGDGLIDSPLNTQHLIRTDDSDTMVWKDSEEVANNVPILSVQEINSGGGKVAYISDSGLFENGIDANENGIDNIYEGDNLQLFFNIINWFFDEPFQSITGLSSLNFEILIPSYITVFTLMVIFLYRNERNKIKRNTIEK
ncbi:MAG: hypothetical protein FK733_04805 [Asgard group archaeon]|nr:hypothetical protein [Asgard group archaeon]